MGVDSLTDENGNPNFEKKDDKEENEKINEVVRELSPRKATIALDPLERMVPRWRG